MSEDTRVSVMGALDLMADVALERAHRHDDLRPLAVLSEAWELAGYSAWCFVDSASYQPLRGIDERRALVTRARRNRTRRLLRADARGVLLALRTLADADLYSCGDAWEANRQRWLARGGHDYPASPAVSRPAGDTA